MSDEQKTPGQKTVERLRRFTEKLEAGIPIEATEVRVEQTPDGILTTRWPTVINSPEE